MNKERNYMFSWDLIGDISDGRGNLGNETPVEVYRLMQFTLRDLVEQYVGTEKTNMIFFKAGKLAGKHFYNKLFYPTKEFSYFIRQLQQILKDFKIGILRLEKINLEKEEFTLTISEDLDCSGMPELDYEVCSYEEGFIASIFECFAGVPFDVEEIDCWCTGDRTCRFIVKATKFYL